jgi:hypothetical protein
MSVAASLARVFLAVSFLVGPVVQGGEASGAKETPFYCDRTALNAEQRARQREVGKILRDAVIASRELRDGYEFEFPGDNATYRALTEYVPLERACCPFFEFNIRLAREGGGLYWRLTGREGVKDFIREEMRWLVKD